MKFYDFKIIIEQEYDKSKGYVAYSPDLPGCFSAGMTVEECRNNMLEAIKVHIEGLIKNKFPLPRKREQDIFVENVAISV